jgi:hypothetical protein
MSIRRKVAEAQSNAKEKGREPRISTDETQMKEGCRKEKEKEIYIGLQTCGGDRELLLNDGRIFL